MRSVFMVAVVLLAGPAAHSKVTESKPIRVATETATWTKEFAAKVAKLKADGAYPATGFTECRGVVEIPGAYLCQSNTGSGMNFGLARASCYVEGLACGHDKGHVLSRADYGFNMAVSSVGGHDLKGVDLLKYHSAMTAECAKGGPDSMQCPHAIEVDLFEKFILPKIKSEPNFVIITFAQSGVMGWTDVVTHEILHAQYFNDAKYRKVCDDFWNNEMTEEERAEVRRTLAAFYDTNDELLMRNEFQAYILMANAEVANFLSHLVPKYRPLLLERLNAVGVAPVQVSID